MGLSLFLPSVVTAVSVGLGCGTCCSPAVGTFLSGYILSHAQGMKKSLWFLVLFFSGKIVAVAALCGFSALVGRQLLTESGMLGYLNLQRVLPFILLVLGIWLTIRWFREERPRRMAATGEGACAACHKQCVEGNLPLLVAGAVYGASPCAPLLIMLGYAAVVPVMQAVVLGCIFAVATSLTPSLLTAIISGALSKRMSQEIPQYIRYFRLLSYLMLIAVGIYSLFNNNVY